MALTDSEETTWPATTFVKPMADTADDEEIKIVAAAIANARGGRRGMPPIKNILDILPAKLREEVLDDASAVLAALAGFRKEQTHG